MKIGRTRERVGLFAWQKLVCLLLIVAPLEAATPSTSSKAKAGKPAAAPQPIVVNIVLPQKTPAEVADEIRAMQVRADKRQ